MILSGRLFCYRNRKVFPADKGRGVSRNVPAEVWWRRQSLRRFRSNGLSVKNNGQVLVIICFGFQPE